MEQPTIQLNILEYLKSFRIFFLGLWLVGLTLVFILIIRFWAEDRYLFIRLANYFMPWFLLVLVPGFFIAILTHRTTLAIIFTLSAVYISCSYLPLFLPKSSEVLANTPLLTVMSYNVWRENKNITKISDVVKCNKPDIILFQELNSDMVHTLINRLNLSLTPKSILYFVYEPKLMQAVVSIYPMNPLHPQQKHSRVQKVLIASPDGLITLFNVHFRRCGNWEKRQNTIAAFMAEEIGPTKGPIIVGGDFNTTDKTNAYHMVSDHLANAHHMSGKGFGFTYPSNKLKIKGLSFSLIPLVRIDHIFYNHYFSALHAETISDAGGSDHLPVLANFKLVGKDTNVFK